MSAGIVAVTAEDYEVDGLWDTVVAGAVTIEVILIWKPWEAKAEIPERDLHRRVRETKRQVY